MNLFEMFDPPVSGYQNVQIDQSQPKWETSRMTKLTLKQLRHYRKMLDVRNYEKKLNLENIRKQYGAAAQAAPSA